MARIVLGVGASHSTLMNTHWHQVAHKEDAHRFREALSIARDAVEAAQPDIAVVVGSNHFRGFWLDLIPAFTLGVGEVIAAGEAGTPKGLQRSDPEFAQTLAEGEASRIRICDNPDCLWVYYDRTRNRSKRYCDDRACGNLMKVRRFRASKKHVDSR